MTHASLLLLLPLLAPAQDRLPVEAQPPAFHGHVRLADGTPVAGHPVRLMRLLEEIAVTVTDEDGAFELPGSERDRLTVRAGVVPGLRAAAERQVPGEPLRYELELREVPTARFVGLAVDLAGLPLADVELQVNEPRGPSETCTTDAEGRFATTVELAEGRVSVQVRRDDPMTPFRPPVRFEHVVPDDGTAPAPVVCRFEVGGRHELDFAPLPGTDVDDYVVHVRPRGEPPATDEWSSSVRTGRVHDGRPAWTRPEAKFTSSRPGDDETLHLLAESGLAGASADLRGADPTRPLRLDLQPLGALRVLVRESAPGLPVQDGTEPGGFSQREHVGVRLELERLGGEGTGVVRSSASVGKERLVRWIEPGRWRCTVVSPYYPSRAVDVDVVAGAVVPLEIVLDPPLPNATLCIRVAAAEGDVREWSSFHDAPELDGIVRAVDPGGAFYVIALSAMCGSGISAWFRRVERDGRFVYEAVLEDVPRGEYRIELTGDDLLAERTRVVRAGDTALFRYARVVPEDAYRYEVLDATSGRPVVCYSVLPLDRGPEPALSEHPAHGGVHAYGLPAGDPVEWCVDAPGHRRAYGDRRAFEPQPPGHVARIVLERGFAMRLVARSPDGLPVAGAQLVFDEHTFTTGLDGRVLLESEQTSPTLALRAGEGWRLTGGDVGEDGRFTQAHAEVRVVVERVP